ncbi:MAG: hypothetical protein GX339_09110 [Tissierellia bacterium]|nr:hypothetical protein [Tissierellia bacterium]
MRKTLLMTLLTLTFFSGCTRLPPAEETGVGPGEYAGIVNLREIKEENENLKSKLDNVQEKLEKLEKENENLSKNNENTLSLLEDAQSKLKIIESEDIPEFNTENTDIDSILSYLNDSANLLDYSQKSIEIITSEGRVVFRTLGYGEDFSQLFVWEEGQGEAVLIEGASFDKEGYYEWLGEYILISNNNDKKLVDINNKKVAASFMDAEKLLLIEDLILIKDSSNNFALYDLVNEINKEINLDNNKYRDFNLQNENIVFTGSYTDNNVEYEIKATISLDKLKEIYEVIDEIERDEMGDSV